MEGGVEKGVVGGGRVTRIMSDVSEHLRPRLEPPQGDRRGSLYSIRFICDRVNRLTGGTVLLPDPGPSDGGGGANTVTTSSPVNKRRVFSGRKWFPPLRKLSGGKVEKNATSTTTSTTNTTTTTTNVNAPDRPPLKKTASDKRFKTPVCTDLGTKPVAAGSAMASVLPSEEEAGRDQNGEEGEEELELPPPMKPISEPILVPPDDSQGQRTSSLSLEGATSADLAEIEQIVKERMEQHNEKQSKLSSSEVSGSAGETEESILQKREYVIRELVETERDYVRDLRLVAEGYMRLMRDPECDIPMPDDLKGGKDKMVFGNLEAIYEWHRDSFLKALERCIQHPEELGPLFKRYERKLLMYVVYCQNKPVSEYIVSEYIDTYFEELRQKLGHKLQLCDLLIKPVQRIMKYQLLLRDLYKYTERAHLTAEMEALRQATHVMQVVPKAANDMMDVGRLQGFDGKITAQGKLLLHGPVVCCEGTVGTNMKGKELQVFLFEQNIIFSEAVGKKTQFTNPVYIYKNHIQVNKMSLDERVPGGEDGVDLFCVRSTDPRKPDLAYVCKATSPENRIEWIQNLTNILKTQRDFLKAIQSPIAYQKELTKDPFEFGMSVRPPSPSGDYEGPSHQPECPVIVSEPLYLRTKHQSNFLEGFRNTLRRAKSEAPEVEANSGLSRRWSDAHPQGPCVRLVEENYVLVSTAIDTNIECCDFETGQWRRVDTTWDDANSGHLVMDLTPGHTYSFRLMNSSQPTSTSTLTPSVPLTIPYEPGNWQTDHLIRRYQRSNHIIGRGRNSCIEEAHDICTGQKVVLKQIERQRQTQCTTRNEYQLLASISHPNIICSLALFENAPVLGIDTIVIELVNGHDICSYINKNEMVSLTVIQSLISQLLNTLSFLKEKRITHCDIKPENLMVDISNDKNPTLKVVDFGSAIVNGTKQSRDSITVDLEFSSPELLQKPPLISSAADVWSVGVILYVLLSGVSPFLDESVEETITHILNQDFSFPEEYFRGIPESAKEFICSLLSSNASTRLTLLETQQSSWVVQDVSNVIIQTGVLKSFTQRRQQQGSMKHIVLLS